MIKWKFLTLLWSKVIPLQWYGSLILHPYKVRWYWPGTYSNIYVFEKKTTLSLFSDNSQTVIQSSLSYFLSLYCLFFKWRWENLTNNRTFYNTVIGGGGGLVLLQSYCREDLGGWANPDLYKDGTCELIIVKRFSLKRKTRF